MTEAQAEAPAQRGRPRPDATVERDERVFKHLEAEGPKTRPELATELDMPGNQIYLSLYRLSRAEPARVEKSGGKWSVVAATPVE
jgi:hypothetical protein